MATFNRISDWFDYMVEDADLASDQFTIALSNTAPGSETNDPTANGSGVLGNVSEAGYTNCSSRDITTTSSSQSDGTYALILQDITLTASGGTVGPLRYVYVYDDTVANDPLAGYYDYGSSITLADGETLLVNFSGTGFFTITEG